DLRGDLLRPGGCERDAGDLELVVDAGRERARLSQLQAEQGQADREWHRRQPAPAQPASPPQLGGAGGDEVALAGAQADGLEAVGVDQLLGGPQADAPVAEALPLDRRLLEAMTDLP